MCIMAESSRRMMMMNWDGLDDDDEEFFDSRNRISSVVSIHIASSGSDDDEDYDDNRISFASAISTPPEEFRSYGISTSTQDYNVWMAEPGSIQDRRQRLLQGMGLTKDKEILRITSIGRKCGASINNVPPEESKQEASCSSASASSSHSLSVSLISRSKSEPILLSESREESFIFTDDASKQRLLRLFSMPAPAPSSSLSGSKMQLKASSIKPSRAKSRSRSKDGGIAQMLSIDNGTGGGSFLIKNLDTGKVFMINEDGTTSSLSDLQTGKQLSMEEFEKSVGHSPIVKELMRRENVRRVPGGDGNGESEKNMMNTFLSKSFRSGSKKKGPNWFKHIKGSINGFMIADREKEHSSMQQQSKGTPSKWPRVHQHGKPYKELTALYMCQEIQAHEGSIWSMKFSCDGQYLASAGEDRVIHIWEVVDCDVLSGRTMDDVNSGLLHPLAGNGSGRPPLADAPLFPSERKKKGRLASGSKKKGGIPDYVTVPDTVFSLSDKPVCSFEGHLDDVLDLSWSKNHQLLSSSMDKTVRLWDMETQTCLKLFAHNDYVTCIQFNPVDDEYFISGSLDAKVRIWSVPERKVVDWSDLHEMVTAVCYTPDGQGALVGSNRGSCRLYDTSECKLHQKGQITVQNKKKSQTKKITGFQFAPGNPTEVLITSADSRIRIFDGTDITHKFRGFRNTSSQISAAFTPDGKYVVSASEDSQVYVWKHDEVHNSHGGKSKGLITTQSYERFQCKDVSIAIPWPGNLKYDPSIFLSKSKLNSKGASINSTQQDSFLRSASVARNLPPLPRKNSIAEKTAIEEEPCTLQESCSRSPSEAVSRTNSGASAVSRMNSRISRTNSEIEDNSLFASAFGSPCRDDSSISATENSFPSLSWIFDSSTNSSRNNTPSPAAWGLVVATAGIGGELRIYQNFGMPVRASRQTNLFASPSVGSSANKRFI